jgi:hypothetical protein
MNRYIVLLLATVIFLLKGDGSLRAQAKITILGAGAQQCSDWNAAQQSTLIPMKERITENKQWILGFLSEQAIISRSDFLRNATEKAIFDEVDRQCKLDPAKTLAQVAINIRESLPK